VCVRWYCKYGISYPGSGGDDAGTRRRRGSVHDDALGHRYAPEFEKRVRWHQGYRATSWRVDKTYVKVGGHLGRRQAWPVDRLHVDGSAKHLCGTSVRSEAAGGENAVDMGIMLLAQPHAHASAALTAASFKSMLS
jgi:hypothetical protein